MGGWGWWMRQLALSMQIGERDVLVVSLSLPCVQILEHDQVPLPEGWGLVGAWGVGCSRAPAPAQSGEAGVVARGARAGPPRVRVVECLRDIVSTLM